MELCQCILYMTSYTRNKKHAQRGGCGCNKQLGGSAVFPATFSGLGGDVHNYALNSYGGDPTYNHSSRLLGGARRRTRRRKSRRRLHKNKKMRGGNFGVLAGNPIMNNMKGV